MGLLNTTITLVFKGTPPSELNFIEEGENNCIFDTKTKLLKLQ